MSGIQTAFQGHVQYQFTTLKVGQTAQLKTTRGVVFGLTLGFLPLQDLRDPLEEIADLKNQEKKKEKSLSNTDR